MGNAIRELKLEIGALDFDMIEQDVCAVFFGYSLGLIFRRWKAKDFLFTKIDNYIRDRIIIADQVIQELAGNKIKDGDVILTYAKSVLKNCHRV